jgi:hypothetical protein
MLRKCAILAFAVVLLGGLTFGYLYVHWVGYPQRLEGRWVRPHIAQWYWSGMPGWPYPGIVQYGYGAADGSWVPHGPYVRRVWTSHGMEIDETGYYIDGQKEGVFTKYQTFYGRPMSREYYSRGRLVRQEFLQSVPDEANHPR